MCPIFVDGKSPCPYCDRSLQKLNQFNVTCARSCLDIKPISMTILEENITYIKLNMVFSKNLIFIILIDKVQCDVCLKYYHSTSIRRHIRNQHGVVALAKCDLCNMTFKNDGVKKDHMRRKHNMFQSGGYQ